VRELLLQRAGELGIEGGEAPDETRIEALLAREITTPRADMDACHRYYQNHLHRFRSPDLVQARHILFAAKANDADAFAAARAKAQSAIDLLQAQPHRFAELAKEFSACPSAKEGGNLGQLTRGSTVPELDIFLFELEPGQLCPVPIRSRYGFHVLEVQQKVEGRTLPFDNVREKIAQYLEQRVWRQAVRQYIELLVGRAKITGIVLKGASSPLVQ
jgi:peptidyl-prolyl cis-trans isomerase C